MTTELFMNKDVSKTDETLIRQLTLDATRHV
jgi:hypothetical protein